MAAEGSKGAEDLRLQGNAAFTKKEWAVAAERYRESIAVDGDSRSSARVYSNLAAALCKLCRYDDAHEAARVAPRVDPGWAKGYWRLGVVCELQKDFLSSLSNYEKAMQLEPGEPTVVDAESSTIAAPASFKIIQTTHQRCYLMHVGEEGVEAIGVRRRKRLQWSSRGGASAEQ